MKITEQQLKQLIKEEVEEALKEHDGHAQVLTEQERVARCKPVGQKFNELFNWLIQIDAKLDKLLKGRA
jgi:hypothetical protein